MSGRLLRFGSLFSGIGGLDLGLERAGMECAWQVEIDDYCRRVLAKHWPDVPRYGDIKELSGDELEPVDLICGGFPCQPVSLAGKKLGQDDERWLWPEFIRIVCAVRPGFVLVENVPGLLVLGMGDVLGDLAASGYDAEWQSLPAAAFGAPHIRERVWIVAHDTQHGRGAGRPRGLDTSGAGQSQQSLQVVADATCQRAGPAQQPGQRDGAIKGGQVFSNAKGDGLQERERQDWQSNGGSSEQGGLDTIREGTIFSDTDRQSLGRIAKSWGQRGEWAIEPNVGRVADGVPARVDRLRALGNAVVPQVAEWLGRRIMAVA